MLKLVGARRNRRSPLSSVPPPPLAVHTPTPDPTTTRAPATPFADGWGETRQRWARWSTASAWSGGQIWSAVSSPGSLSAAAPPHRAIANLYPSPPSLYASTTMPSRRRWRRRRLLCAGSSCFAPAEGGVLAGAIQVRHRRSPIVVPGEGQEGGIVERERKENVGTSVKSTESARAARSPPRGHASL
ncbi:Os05g0408066 [Oryza sativa Japonica Group]|uniref:Os05g0408066 protein n=1 Tax=Oryza sativa subsp. japonica TaxID=39947 RepID=A0A0P0WMB0_ORYSJ|nr:Os05g0408066 [Oryza sativa Japonica Group]